MADAHDLAHLRRCLASGDGPAFWRSLDAVAETSAFQAYLRSEFPGALALAQGPERRGFLKLMAASFALAGLSACDAFDGRGREVPYVVQPERIVASAPLAYASSALFDGFANGILVTTRNGRPLKVEGNPEHPWSRGGTDVLAQASVLGLYDPFRSQAVQHLGRPSAWAAFRGALLPRLTTLRETGGAGFHLLTGPVTSPSLAAGIARLRAAYPGLRWHVAETVPRTGLYEGARQAYGRPLETQIRFDRAHTLVALDGDFLEVGPGQVGLSRRWIEARRAAQAAGGLLTLHAAASTPGLTSSKADHTLAAEPDDLVRLAHNLLRLAEGGRPEVPDGPMAAWIARTGAALLADRGRSVVTAGLGQPAEVHALVHRINGALGNTGVTVLHTAPVPVQGAESLSDLVDAMARGSVGTLLMLGVNPAYAAPGDLAFAERLSRVPFKIHAAAYFDETAAHADWHLPLAHPLESWGDARSLDGTVGLIQPTVAPLYGGRSAHEILTLFGAEAPANEASAPQAPGTQGPGTQGPGTQGPANEASVNEGAPQGRVLLERQWRGPDEGDAAFAARFSEALRLGFLPDSALAVEAVTLSGGVVPAPSTDSGDRIALVFRPDPCVWDGAEADLGWLQELPKPLTKVVWENVVALSPTLAERLRLSTGDIVAVEANGRRLEGAAWILPGQAERTVTLTLGYGRRVPDHLAHGLGYDANALRSSATPYGLSGVTLTRTGRHAKPVTTQDLGTMQGHDFVRVQAVGAPSVGDPPGAAVPSFYPEALSAGRGEASAGGKSARAWGMVIDLDACIGCNACLTACQSENNIPVVGREEVARGRWMNWLRVDRYYAGGLDAPKTHFQPVPCMHCEQAPCELGCPVEATVHDSEGLNLQVYNRCIGTRTCQSYCPYKVRRFNFLDYTGGAAPVEQQQRNPEVTVRARGVMEKCTYCLQRIAGARIDSAKDAHAPIPDGVVETACQGACPTRAIVFGDLADDASRVAAARRDPRNYALLGDLNTRPRTTYLASLAPGAPDAEPGREG
ncbi:molybdopterin oxidoreductase [Methylobacterium sp. Leaf113]|uniref:TAT-variant-translocated molybdopterin oxidoreductase n=1 Tax=Methylobacterium sp. Leaf113 TaxID=1736259 RepID=UPI0006F3C7C8|nr:TAT-variant-translocated molybdopterin oxidoreductase [Methylobacterium sp. Leaf113]KQP72924.1 molybdopterin oxidoreductase [Methylobacterium sp. Leaf113]